MSADIRSRTPQEMMKDLPEDNMSGLQLSQDKLIAVYRSMRMIRRFE
ncbi:ABC transporter substrate-binding protein, partial [Rhizobium phaseoli]